MTTTDETFVRATSGGRVVDPFVCMTPRDRSPPFDNGEPADDYAFHTQVGY